jgi:hypothetical protein
MPAPVPAADIETFRTVTRGSLDAARKHLQESQGNLQQAVLDFLELGEAVAEGDPDVGSASPVVSPATGSRGMNSDTRGEPAVCVDEATDASAEVYHDGKWWPRPYELHGMPLCKLKHIRDEDLPTGIFWTWYKRQWYVDAHVVVTQPTKDNWSKSEPSAMFRKGGKNNNGKGKPSGTCPHCNAHMRPHLACCQSCGMCRTQDGAAASSAWKTSDNRQGRRQQQWVPVGRTSTEERHQEDCPFLHDAIPQFAQTWYLESDSITALSNAHQEVQRIVIEGFAPKKRNLGWIQDYNNLFLSYLKSVQRQHEIDTASGSK